MPQHNNAPPRILPRTPTCLLTTTTTITTTTQQHYSRTIYTPPATALCQYLSRQPRVPSIASLSISGRRWASRVDRYVPPSAEERARAVAAAAAGGRALVPGSELVERSAPPPGWSGGGVGGRGRGDGGGGGGGGAAWGGRGNSSASVRERERDTRNQWHRENDRGGSGRESDRNPSGGGAAQYTGPRRRLPNPAPPPSKKRSTLHSETNIPHLSQDELGSVFSQEVPPP